jgi:hypothetical protein
MSLDRAGKEEDYKSTTYQFTYSVGASNRAVDVIQAPRGIGITATTTSYLPLSSLL